MEDAYIICNTTTEHIHSNIEERDEKHAPTKEDTYDNSFPDDKSTHGYIHNPDTSNSLEYPNPVFAGNSSKHFPEQGVKEKPPKKEHFGICSVFVFLLVTDIAVIGIGVYYYVLFTDKITKNNDLILATIARLDSHNTSRLLSNDVSVKQEAKINSLNASSMFSKEVLLKQKAKIDSLNVSNMLNKEVLVKQEARINSLNVSNMLSKEVLVKQEARMNSLNVSKILSEEVLLKQKAKINSLNVSNMLSKEVLVKQEAKINFLNVSTMFSKEVLLKQEAKINSLNVSNMLSKEVLVKQEAKINSLNVSSMLSKDVNVKHEAKINSLNVSSMLSKDALVKQEAKINFLNVSNMLSKDVLVKHEAQLKGLINAVRELQLAVDGVYGPWTNYTTCTRSCGSGYQTRNRKCDSPPPNIYGKNCTRLGNSTETRLCNTKPCPVDGGYGQWTGYGACTKSCATGVQQRNRSCDTPVPAHSGKDCTSLGKPTETRTCNTQKCPVDGGYGQWTGYGTCTKTCATGVQQRNRSCDTPTPAHNGKDCTSLGQPTETRTCNTQKCPVDGGYGQWTNYGACSKTCGPGTKKRSRSCNKPAPKHGGKNCTSLGNSTETKPCNKIPCYRVTTSGTCTTILTKSECKRITQSRGNWDWDTSVHTDASPPGCSTWQIPGGSVHVRYNSKSSSTKICSNRHKCVCAK